MQIRGYLALLTALVAGVSGLSLGCSGSGDSVGAGPPVEAGPLALRRLTAEQYAASVQDVLGEHITVPGRIDPDERREGLLSVGSTFAGITPSGFEKYEAAAAVIAEQALDADHRADLVQCQPASERASDDACARSFLGRVGRSLFRRDLRDPEVEARVAVASMAADTLGSFYQGLELALSSLLVSPDFLFRVERGEPDPDDPSRIRLTATSVASRLSYLIWNTTPDDELLDVALDGSLLDRAVLTAQVDRLLESSRAEVGIRALFSDMLDFRQFDDGLVNKDAALFPAFTQTIARDSKEQTLRTVIDHLSAGQDYRDLFTTRRTFLSRELGQVYRVPVVTPFGFEPHVFESELPRSGILGHASLMSLHSHAGRSSATLRGKFVREVLLCQDVPTPPADIDFSIVEDTESELRTARDRLEVHVANESCAGCHNLMDPIGLAFENFDATGVYRETENGVTIDATGELDGVSYDGPVEASEAIRNHPNLGPCFVQTLFRYTVGREAVESEWELTSYLAEQFEQNGFNSDDLIRGIVLSEGFLATSGPREAQDVPSEEAEP
ncbi:MAG: DUF1588 domain-containing protein [Myxococcota bacterium]